MFGILDRLGAGTANFTDKRNNRVSFYVKELGSSKDVWYCFVPGGILKNEKIREGVLPSLGKVVVYPLVIRI